MNGQDDLIILYSWIKRENIRSWKKEKWWLWEGDIKHLSKKTSEGEGKKVIKKGGKTGGP